MSIMDYMIGANLGKAQGEAIERSRSRTAEQIHAIERESLQDDNAHNMGMLAIVVAAWKGRYEREQSARRGWQEHGMAATRLVQKLTGTDKEGAKKLIAESIKQHQVEIDASLTKVDDMLFRGDSQH